MKKYNNFIDTAPYWKVFLVGFIVSALLIFGLTGYLATTFTFIMKCKLAGYMGLICGGMYLLTTHMMRDAKKFWDMASSIEKKIISANTRAELDALNDDEFKKLDEHASHQIHTMECARLSNLLVNKYRLI